MIRNLQYSVIVEYRLYILTYNYDQLCTEYSLIGVLFKATFIDTSNIVTALDLLPYFSHKLDLIKEYYERCIASSDKLVHICNSYLFHHDVHNNLLLLLLES